MADQEIRQLTEETAVNDSDLYIMQKSSNNDTVKVQAQNMVPDGSITAPKMDFGGSGVGVWWEEIGRTTLGVAGDSITVSSLPARTYLMIIYVAFNSGSINVQLRFNGDATAKYAYRNSNNGAADGTAGTQNEIQTTASGSTDIFGQAYIYNKATEEKMVNLFTSRNTPGVANIPGRLEGAGKWVNTTDLISSITAVNTSTGDFEAGSVMIVMGHN